MKKLFTAILSIVAFVSVQAQSLYFPPLTGSTWETMNPSEIGWCQHKVDSMLDFIGSQESKAFIVLKDGKIIIEKYYGTFTQDSVWYWASAGKSLTSVLVGIAQENGLLNIDSSSSHYMGNGWTSLTPTQEKAIKVRHQLSMTTGLNDNGVLDCTLPSCLTYLAAPGTRWSYHNGPYTLLDSVVENATGMTMNQFNQQKVKSKTGMTGLYVKVDYNNVYFSTARSMARFGLLMLNKGKWNNQTVLGDTAYYNAMVHSSQNMNLSYGYLWWLNGQGSYMLPQSQFVFNGSAISNAPDDMFAALGKNGQLINIVPSQDLVFVRMGNPPSGNSALVSTVLDNQIWAHMNDLACNASVIENVKNTFTVFPNPSTDVLYLSKDNIVFDEVSVYTAEGKEVMKLNNCAVITISQLENGVYFLKIRNEGEYKNASFIKK